MSQEDTNLENEVEEAASEEEIKSGLKIRTNLKAGALLLSSGRLGTKGITEAVAINPYLDLNVALFKY